MKDTTKFPNETYKDTVLAPLFEGAKAHFVQPIRAINQAHLVMLAETKIVDEETAAKIANALLHIDQNVDVDGLQYTGEFEDYFFLVEAELKSRLGPDIAGALHTARSRNDMDHTVFKLVLQQRTDALLALAQNLADQMVSTAQRESDTLIVAYTHGQPAQPSTFGHYLGAATEVLLRDIERLELARKSLDKCPMGAAAITTSGFPIDRHRMANLLGFGAPQENAYGCIASVDYVTGLYSAMKLLFLHLGRLVQDFQFWSAFEVGQLYVPNSFVQISSIMPQKRNPVPIEHLRLLSSLSVGRCDMMVNNMHNTPFTDMNDSEGEVQQAGYAAFESGGRVLQLLSAFVPALSINADKVRQNTDASCITITELADTLVRKDGLSFRQAHEVAAQTAKSVIAKNVGLAQGYEDFLVHFGESIGQKSCLDLEMYQRAVAAEHFVKVRDRFGGPGPDALRASLDGYQKQIKLFKENLAANLKKQQVADDEREKSFNQLASKRGN